MTGIAKSHGRSILRNRISVNISLNIIPTSPLPDSEQDVDPLELEIRKFVKWHVVARY